MKLLPSLAGAAAAYVVFSAATYVWHVTIFIDYYVGPDNSVKSQDDLSAGFLLVSLAVLMLAMTFFVLASLKGPRRVRDSALLGSAFVLSAVVFHSLLLNAQFPFLDPLSYYLLDAAWAAIFGAVAGAIVVAVHDRLGAVAQPAPHG